jgi:hypothetical protein
MEALAFVILILGVLALLAFSPWFRRFALVCVALFIVAAGVVYVKINRENEQAMARECAPIPGQTIPNPPNLQEKCNKWLAEHPEQECSFTASANRQAQIDLMEHNAKQEAELAERAAKGLPLQPLPDREIWPDITLKELREKTIACKKWLADQNNNQEK